MNEEAITTLNELIYLDVDAVSAYRQAIDACEVAEVKSQLITFKGDHERHVTELEGLVRSLGGEPASGRDLKGFFIEGFTAIMSRGDRSALLAMRANEEITTRKYEAALRANLAGEARALVEKNEKDEARHRAWIKAALERRAWDASRGKAA
jgi:uncharacterized protein (TIGR02284 family)